MKLFSFEVSEALVVAIFFLMAIVSLLLQFKPGVMFTSTGQFKKFGTGNIAVNTLFPFWLVATVFGVSVYSAYSMFY